MRTTIPTQREIEELQAEMQRELAPLREYRSQILMYAMPRYFLSVLGEFGQMSYDPPVQQKLDWIAEQEAKIVEQYKKRLE